MEEILVLAALDSSDDDIEDAVDLHILHDDENLGNREALYGRFNLENLFEAECTNFFRFGRNDILRLAQCLNIPERLTTANRVTVSSKYRRLRLFHFFQLCIYVYIF